MLGFLFALPAFANRVALVIGNTDYPGLLALRAPVRDARAIAQVLRQDHGFKVEVLENASGTEIKRALGRFGRDAKNAESAVIYYSGHGVSNQSGKGFMVPLGMPDLREVDDFEQELKVSAVAIDDVTVELEQTNAKVQLLIIDACRDYPIGKSAAKSLSGVNTNSSNMLIAYATKPGRLARDGSNTSLSPFAAALVPELRRAQQTPLRDLLDNVADEVLRQTDRRQEPWNSGNLRARMCLTGVCIAAQPLPATTISTRIVDREQEAWTEIQNSTNIATVQAFLVEFPNGNYAARARLRIASLKPTPQDRPTTPLQAKKVTIAADVFFESEKSTLRTFDIPKLDELSNRSKSLTLEVIIAVGHTDSFELANEAARQSLSVARAEATKKYLVSTGVEKNRVYTEGKGSRRPRANNNSVEGRGMNRVVDLELVGTTTTNQ